MRRVDPFGQTRSAQRPKPRSTLQMVGGKAAPFPSVHTPPQPVSQSPAAQPYSNGPMHVIGTVVSPTTIHLTESGPVDSEVEGGRYVLEFPQSKVGKEIRMRVREVDPVTSDVILKWMTVYKEVEGENFPVRSVTFSAL